MYAHFASDGSLDSDDSETACSNATPVRISSNIPPLHSADPAISKNQPGPTALSKRLNSAGANSAAIDSEIDYVQEVSTLLLHY